MSNAHCVQTLTCDAEEHAASLGGWEQRYEQLSAGCFQGFVEDLRIGSVQIFHEHANQSVLQLGRPRKNTVTIALTRAASGAGWYCGHALEGGCEIGFTSSGDFELVTAAGTSLLAVCVDTSDLAQMALRTRGQDFRLIPPGASLLNRSTGNHGALKGLLDCARLLAREQPELLEQAAVRRMLVESLTEATLDCISPDQLEADLRPSAATRRRIVASARDHMQAHVEQPITVPDLCAATGASRRALQYAFEDVVRLSPATYLRVMRLNRARSDLRSDCGATVGDVAARWGFWHLPRFAAEYRRPFGELPSATRARCHNAAQRKSH